MAETHIVIVGGGAAGVFAAIACAESSPFRVSVFEKGLEFLSKVRISGGGRCNVTHACFDPRKLSESYPRGGQALIGPFHRFQPRDTVEWFKKQGVKLKTESDGRVFPVSNLSQTIIDCLLNAARKAEVRLVAGNSVEHVTKVGSSFNLTLCDGTSVLADRLMLATGGCRTPAAAHLAVALGHTLEPPVPSLFAFHADAPWLVALAGISIDNAAVSVPGTNLQERGPLLITHAGLSGPAILRISAWGARELHKVAYKFPVRVNWLPHMLEAGLITVLQDLRKRHPAKRMVNTTLPQIPSRLSEALMRHASIGMDTRWAGLSNTLRNALVAQLTATELQIIGKSLNKDEFVTCGGIPLAEVDFKTMQSRIVPGLFFGGELLDIDGITGGFNFQAAWTTGWIAGKAMGGHT